MINVIDTSPCFRAFCISVYGGVAVGYWYRRIYTGLIILSI